jgi:hypothetical protein
MLARRLALAIGLLFGVIGAQIPEFAQQYRQRLGGALDELHRIISEFDAETATQSLTRVQGVERLKANGDALARQRGEAIETDAARAERLERQREAFLQAGSLSRLAVLAGNFDPTTASEAIRDFEPAIPVTIEAFVIGGVAMVFGWSAAHLIAAPFRRRRRADRQNAAA